MSSTEPFAVQLAPAAARGFRKLEPASRSRVRRALEKLSADVAGPGRVGGKSVKTIQGVGDSFHRLRVGDYRVLYDVITDERVLLVLAVVHRGELERWLRNR